MKITDRRESITTQFKKLEIGDVFQQGGSIYIKISIDYYSNNDGTEYDNALWLNSTERIIKACHFDPDEIVIPREAKLILK